MKFLLSCCLFSAVCCLAQTPHHHVPPPENARVDLATLPDPQRIDGIGHAHIAITTKSLEAQQWFDQGLALLHCFWDYEAIRAFEQAVRFDPDCAMCHWGLARALDSRGGDKGQAKAELKKAQELAPKASDHEQRYIRADAASDDAASGNKDGDGWQAAYAKQMEVLIERYPDDIDAKLFYALSLNNGYDADGNPRSGSLYGQSILRQILAAHPDNAAANHYWIHAMEVSDHPELAL